MEILQHIVSCDICGVLLDRRKCYKRLYDKSELDSRVDRHEQYKYLCGQHAKHDIENRYIGNVNDY